MDYGIGFKNNPFLKMKHFKLFKGFNLMSGFH